MKLDPRFSDAVTNMDDNPRRLHMYLTVCDECGGEMSTGPSVSDIGFMQIDNGWSLDLNGGYGMFTDEMSSFEVGPVDTFVHLCHDCCVLFVKTFPNATKRFGLGHHPYEGSEPCCEWGWTTIDVGDVKVLVYGDGTREELK